MSVDSANPTRSLHLGDRPFSRLGIKVPAALALDPHAVSELCEPLKAAGFRGDRPRPHRAADKELGENAFAVAAELDFGA